MNFSKKSIALSMISLWILSCGTIYLAGKIILTPQFFLDNDQILSFNPSQNFSLYEKMQQWSYLYEALYCLVRVAVVTCILHTAIYLLGQTVNFRNILVVVILSEHIFIIAAISKIFWFLLLMPHGTLMDWHKTYLLSAASIFNDLPPLWIYPLSVINLFEVGYWFTLAYGLSKVTDLSFDNSLKVITRSYLPALIIWVICICFCSVLVFPSHI